VRAGFRLGELFGVGHGETRVVEARRSPPRELGITAYLVTPYCVGIVIEWEQVDEAPDFMYQRVGIV
jgi:hypothetical protein